MTFFLHAAMAHGYETKRTKSKGVKAIVGSGFTF
jgi:hypothetical protein